MASKSILNEDRDRGAGVREMKGAGFMWIGVAESREGDVYI